MLKESEWGDSIWKRILYSFSASYYLISGLACIVFIKINHPIPCMCPWSHFLFVQFLETHILFELKLLSALPDPDRVHTPSLTEYWKPLAEDVNPLPFLS